jgi:ferredoxin
VLTYDDLPLLPTKTLGSHAVPSWLWLVRDAHERGELGPADLDESLRDAVEEAADMCPVQAITVEG